MRRTVQEACIHLLGSGVDGWSVSCRTCKQDTQVPNLEEGLLRGNDSAIGGSVSSCPSALFLSRLGLS